MDELGHRTAHRSRDLHKQKSASIVQSRSYKQSDSDNENHAKSGESQKQWSNSEDLETCKQEIKTLEDNTEETDAESSGIKNSNKSRKIEKQRKTRHSDIYAREDNIPMSSQEKRRRKGDKKQTERRRLERCRAVDDDHHNRIDSRSLSRHYNEDDKLQRKKRSRSQADGEVHITEILKNEDNAHIKYEEPMLFPELTTDTIYIQGKNSFSAVRIGGLRGVLQNNAVTRAESEVAGINGDGRDLAWIPMHTLIKIAIRLQKFWKSTGLVFQGLLGGMALIHFVMMHIFFNTSMEFLYNYSIFFEVYTNVFSFLIVLCVISIFDKFDLTRFDIGHLREIYTGYVKSAIAVPIYFITFGFHQGSLRMDDRLALLHYCNINETIWSNSTSLGVFLDNLNGWQKITLSKDMLAVLAWLFIVLGTRDDMLLMHLESMDKYATNVQLSSTIEGQSKSSCDALVK